MQIKSTPFTGYKLYLSTLSVETHFVNFFTQFVGYFCFLRLHQLTHHRKYVLTPLWSGICRIQVMQRYILQCQIINIFWLLLNSSLFLLLYLQTASFLPTCITSFRLWTSPLGSGTYSSASKSNSVANASLRPMRLDAPLLASM